MKRIAIYDMDGTIVCSMHRYRTIVDNGIERIDLDYWRANEYRALDDSLLPLAEQYKNDLDDPHCIVVIATARILRNADRAFIYSRLGTPDHIVSRNENDNRSGATLKIDVLIGVTLAVGVFVIVGVGVLVLVIVAVAVS